MERVCTVKITTLGPSELTRQKSRILFDGSRIYIFGDGPTWTHASTYHVYDEELIGEDQGEEQKEEEEGEPEQEQEDQWNGQSKIKSRGHGKGKASANGNGKAKAQCNHIGAMSKSKGLGQTFGQGQG